MPFRPITQPGTTSGFKPSGLYSNQGGFSAMPESSGLPSFLNPVGIKTTPEADYWGKGAVDFAKSAAKPVGEIAAGAVSQIPQIAGNVGSFGMDVASNALPTVGIVNNAIRQGTTGAQIGLPNQEGKGFTLGEGLKSLGEFGKSQAKEGFQRLGVDTNTPTFQAGGIGADIAASIYGGNLAGKAAATATQLPNYGRAILGSVLGTAGSSIPTSGRLPNAEELAAGGAIDLATGAIGKVARKMGIGAYKLGIKPEGETIEQFDKRVGSGLDLGLTGTNKQIANKAQKVISKKGAELEKIVKASPNMVSVDKLTNDTVEAAVAAARQGDEAKNNALMKLVNNFKKANKADMNMSEVLTSKRYYADEILPTLRNADLGKTSIAAKKIFAENIWKNANDTLSAISPRVKNLNDDMSAAYAYIKPATKGYKKGIEVDFTNIKKMIPASTLIPSTIGRSLNAVSKTMPVISSAAKYLRSKVLK